MIALARKIDDLIEPLRKIANCVASPVLDLGIRLWMANTFFWSGWSKFKNFLNDDWGTTVYLFQEVHVVPFLSPNIAAIAGTATEFALPILLVFGLFSRFAAAGLFATTVLIQYFVADGFGDSLSNPDHYFWMLLLLVTLIKGPGLLSLDHVLVKFIRK